MTNGELIKKTLIVCCTVTAFFGTLIAVGGTASIVLYQVFAHRAHEASDLIAPVPSVLPGAHLDESVLPGVHPDEYDVISGDLVEESPTWPPEGYPRDAQEPFGGLIVEP